MTYLLDTNVCIFAMRGNGNVIDRLSSHAPEDCAISMVTVFEFYAGGCRYNHPQKEAEKVATFLERFHLLPFDRDAALRTAEIRFALERTGRKISPYDL